MAGLVPAIDVLFHGVKT